MRFEQIMPAVVNGEVDAGVIIHEGRFTYEKYGLTMVDDLGVWWEETTNYPIPLGAIIAKRSLGDKKIGEIEAAVRKSLLSAFSDPDAPLEFMKQHAGEMDLDVMRRHVELYVNNYSLDYGEDGIKAITYLIECADKNGLLEG